jgi:hypothetical protein
MVHLLIYRTDEEQMIVVQMAEDDDRVKLVQDMLLDYPPGCFEPDRETPYTWEDVRNLEHMYNIAFDEITIEEEGEWIII